MTEIVEDIDRGWNQIVSDAKARDRSDLVVDIGIIGEEAAESHADSALTNAQVGTFQEFGTPTIPERPAIRSTIDEKHNQIARLLKRVASGLIDGKLTERVGLGLVGVQVVSWIKSKIRAHIPPPLKDSTIKKKTVGGKKGDVPWIDTGQVLGAFTHAVRGESEGAE